MAKTRMNSGHRTVLTDFAEKKIAEVIDRKQEHKLYKKLLAAANTALRKKYPEKDMEILRKYKLVRTDHCIKFLFPSGRVDGMSFTKEDGEPVDIPYRYGCYGLYEHEAAFPVSAEIGEALDEYNLIKAANDNLYRQKYRDCANLISYAKYVEDVLEVIKVPKEIENKLCAKSTALVALSPDVIARIQADFNA